jgi:hypothetical protein
MSSLQISPIFMRLWRRYASVWLGLATGIESRRRSRAFRQRPPSVGDRFRMMQRGVAGTGRSHPLELIGSRQCCRADTLLFRCIGDCAKDCFSLGPGWWNGRHRGLKILWGASPVRVRVPPPASCFGMIQNFFFSTPLALRTPGPVRAKPLAERDHPAKIRPANIRLR